MERGLERGVEGWGGPLIWKVWCEWRTSGSPRWWILLHMQYGKVIHPSFSSVFSLLLHPQPFISSTCNHPPGHSALAHITSSFLLSWLFLLVWVYRAAPQTSSQPHALLCCTREKRSRLDTHIFTLASDTNMIWWLTFQKNWNSLGKSKPLRVKQQLCMCVRACIKAITCIYGK